MWSVPYIGRTDYEAAYIARASTQPLFAKSQYGHGTMEISRKVIQTVLGKRHLLERR
jgi:hypothetical protein